ncbi:MAG TPA: bifunctional hydroxymethylpyrimidine kinase/phosphomethylpyrimidine kinase [Alloacidobacterium sp.]|jgi:hydroxymethylpyrimidine/phosphomethylpyrimidine kinase|nr:bifunctional hydroxymethylpyrimidine kinase/phosphomethylpyrimidine kinase [Alloacidobacterium sp.]
MNEAALPACERDVWPIALTIAGFDPSSGAGISADLKVFAAHRVYGMACITALTVQSTLGVRRVEPVEAATVREMLACLREDAVPAGVKIGMLATAGIVDEVAEFLAFGGVVRERVVLDPVVRSSSGRELLDREGVVRLRAELLGRVGWVTPNVDELAVLVGAAPLEREDVPRAAAELGRAYPGLHVLVTGGEMERPDDFLLLPSGESVWLEGSRVETTSTHGTGCALSSALLCELIAGKGPEAAARDAKEYVTKALRAAYAVGRGRGPMDHLFGMCMG